MFIHSRTECSRKHTRFQTKKAQKPNPLGRHILIWLAQGSTPPVKKLYPSMIPSASKDTNPTSNLNLHHFLPLLCISESLPSGGIWLGGKSQVWDVYNLRDYNQHVSDDGTALWAATSGGCSAWYPFISSLFRYNPDKSLGEGFSHTVNFRLYVPLPPPPS